MSDFGEGRWMVGRKDHVCGYCGGLIPRGEELYHYHGMFDGEWQNWRMHRECRDDFDMNSDGEFTFGDAPVPERVQALVADRRATKGKELTRDN